MLPRYLNDGTTDKCLSVMLKMGGWDVITPLTDLCFGDVDNQPHPAVSLHSCIQDSLEVLWSVSHKSAVICILQLKDPHSVQLGGCLQPPDVEEIAI